MIMLCKCGRMKNAQPFRSAAQAPWLCDDCSPAKASMKAAKAAQAAHGGRSYPLQPVRQPEPQS